MPHPFVLLELRAILALALVVGALTATRLHAEIPAELAAASKAAAAKKPHVEAVIKVLEQAQGTYEKMNTAPVALTNKPEAPAFDTLKSVNLSSPALGIKGKRKVDPFDHAFYEHLGHITDLESLTILNTSASNEEIAELAKLTNLKVLNIINQGKLNDEGLAHLAGLKQLERLGYIGTQMQGHPFKEFAGWTNLKSASFRGSKLDDEGLQSICERFPQVESLVLAHADFSDAAAVNLAKLKSLKNFEIGTHMATPEALRNIVRFPIEFLQLGEQFGSPEGVAIIKGIPTLRRLTITDATKMTDPDLAQVASMKQLDHLELGQLDLTDERVPQLKQLAFLKTARLVGSSKAPYSPELRTKIQEAMPKTKVAFE
ncbi:MAG TPA: G protein-coupled receptor LGR4 [Chthoniobacteraceae bacterium]|jgi:hypothetical protein|nr:G protein-coupled receptor LGR4 [Chthoniobacteraceae bacterium]